MNNLPPVTRKIIIVNVFAFVIYRFSNFDFISSLALYDVTSPHFHSYQLITHLFVHASLWHLFSNMITLLSFGPPLEYKFHSRRFLFFYLLTGVGASVFYLLVSYICQYNAHTAYMNYFLHPDPDFFNNYLKRFPNLYNNYYGFIYDYLNDRNNVAFIEKSKAIMAQLYSINDVPVVGASGAVFGVLTAFAMLYKDALVGVMLIPMNMPAKVFVVLYGLYELFAGIGGNVFDSVAHFAHVGGIVLAYIFVKIWNRGNRFKIIK